MTLVMDRTEEFPDAVLDLENATWICVKHGTVMKIETGEDCPECPAHRTSPDRMRETCPG